MAHISDEELKRLQKLSNIHLSDEEKELLRGQMDNIIAFLEKLNDIGTTWIEPLSHPVCGHITDPQNSAVNEVDDGSLVSNIQHKMVNNAVKIKSMLH